MPFYKPQNIESIYPLKLKDILGMSFSFIRSNFDLYARSMGVVVVPLVTVIVLSTKNLILSQHGFSLTSLKADIAYVNLLVQRGGFLGNLAGFVNLFLIPLAAGIASRIAGVSFLGAIPNSASATRIGMRFVFALMWAALIIHLAELVGLVIFVLPGIFVAVVTAVVTPVIVLETKGPFSAIRRSWDLVRPKMFKIFGFVVGITITSLIANFVFIELSSIFSSVLSSSFSWIIVVIMQSIQTIVVTSFVATATTLIYLDARIYLEDFHLDLEDKVDVGDFFLG